MTDVKPVVTCDTHYVNKEDYNSHDTLLCLQTNKFKSEINRFRFSSNDFYVKTDEEVIRDLKYLPLDEISVVSNTTFPVSFAINLLLPVSLIIIKMAIAKITTIDDAIIII
jgi:DNA polymerase-3 subunit alpha